MTHDQILILAAPLFAVVGIAATGFFVMWRINRYGRVFNWPANADQTTVAPKK